MENISDILPSKKTKQNRIHIVYTVLTQIMWENVCIGESLWGNTV